MFNRWRVDRAATGEGANFSLQLLVRRECGVQPANASRRKARSKKRWRTDVIDAHALDVTLAVKLQRLPPYL